MAEECLFNNLTRYPVSEFTHFLVLALAMFAVSWCILSCVPRQCNLEFMQILNKGIIKTYLLLKYMSKVIKSYYFHFAKHILQI